MKSLIKLTLLTGLVFLFSCSSKQEEMMLKSPEGNIELNFKANKPTALDPFDVKMDIKGYGKDKSLTLDMYNSEFNSETVLVDWKDENTFIITFKQSDDDNRVMDVYLSESEIRLQERGSKELNSTNPLLNL